jgi:hypothetical protein
MSSLVFHSDSFTGTVNLVSTSAPYKCQVTLVAHHVDNLTAYLAGLTDNTLVALCSVQSQGGGAIVNGEPVLYAGSSVSPPTFVTGEFAVNPPDTVALLSLDFAYNGDTPFMSNGVFGGATINLAPTNPVQLQLEDGVLVSPSTTMDTPVSTVTHVFATPGASSTVAMSVAVACVVLLLVLVGGLLAFTR